MIRIRLLPAAMVAMGALFVAKVDTLWRSPPPVHNTRTPPPAPPPSTSIVPPAQASGPPAAAEPAATIPTSVPSSTGALPGGDAPSPEQAAERAVLESLRARRTELQGREQAIASREVVLAAAERRLNQRIEELAQLQRRLEAAERNRVEREDQGWRNLVKLYETMRPRDAAAIFNDLEMTVLVQVMDRMREAKAAPIMGAMNPERARQLTAELARHRARPPVE